MLYFWWVLSAKALSSSPAHSFLRQSIKQFMSISHCSLSLYITYYTEFSSNEKEKNEDKNEENERIGKWRIHGNNGQEKAICILHINKTFSVSTFSILSILLENTFIQNFYVLSIFPTVHLNKLSSFLLIMPFCLCGVLWQVKKNLVYSQNIKLLQFLVNSEKGISLNLIM